MKRLWIIQAMTILVAGLSALIASPAQATLIVLAQRNAPGTQLADYVDWTELGAVPTAETSVSGVISDSRVWWATNTHSGAGITFSKPETGNDTFNLMTQGTSGNNWDGNFALGDGVMTTRGSAGITNLWIDFSSPVQGAGAQINPNPIPASEGDQFDVTIRAYDTSLALLGSFTVTGTWTTGGGNTAPFVGVFSDTANIGRIEYFTTINSTDGGVVLNQFDILEQAVPEPSIVMLLGMGGVLLMWRRGQRR